jgi:hypothetical protein
MSSHRRERTNRLCPSTGDVSGTSLYRQVSPSSVPPESFAKGSFADASTTDGDYSQSLDYKYRQGLKKLATSMRHSDMTRNAIKRQCARRKFSYRDHPHHHPFGGTSYYNSSSTTSFSVAATYGSTPGVGDKEGHRDDFVTRQQDFFLSPRCEELEDCRRQLWRMMILHEDTP